ncbi:MAG: integrase arm-type DNA-binding domain-containing protein [Cocleimonas sp.]
MAIEKLHPLTVKNAEPKDKDYRLADGGNLYLLVKKNGAMWWRFNYAFKGKRKTLSLGVYKKDGSGVSVKEARDKRTEAKKNLKAGIDPSSLRKEAKEQILHNTQQQKRLDAGLPPLNSFEFVAREWGKLEYKTWDNKNQRDKRQLENHIFPHIGALAIDGIKPSQLREALFIIRDKGALDTAVRTLKNCGRIYRYAILNEYCKDDITLPLAGILPQPVVVHQSALTEPKDVKKLLQSIAEYHGSVIVKTALEIAPLVFVRPIELRSCKWVDVNLKTAEWRYLVTKTETPHIVPLARQAIALFERLKPITGHCPYVFPSLKTPNGERTISENTLNSALRGMGYSAEQMCAHGFRATARTLLDEVLGIRVDLIEHQLAHVPKTFNGRAYNRTAFLPERAEMMQSWADYLDDLKNTPNNG